MGSEYSSICTNKITLQTVGIMLYVMKVAFLIAMTSARKVSELVAGRVADPPPLHNFS